MLGAHPRVILGHLNRFPDLGAHRAAARGIRLTWLLTRLRPRLAEELGEEVAGAIFVRNPARAFAVEWVAGS